MCDAYEVIAGMHRVKAFRRLEREKIPAVVLEVDDLHAELMLIDENLCRNDLSPAERAAAQARRKAIYQQLHPETKAGVAQGEGKKRSLSGHLRSQTKTRPFRLYGGHYTKSFHAIFDGSVLWAFSYRSDATGACSQREDRDAVE